MKYDILNLLALYKFKLRFIPKVLWGRIRKKPLILHLATPQHGNLGDHAIVYAMQNIIKKAFPDTFYIEVRNSDYVRFYRIIEKYASLHDIVMIDGGGNLGTLWPEEDDKIRDIILRFQHNKIIIFPQTCYYDDTDMGKNRIKQNKMAYEHAEDLLVMLRDEASYEIFCKLFANTKSILVPDIVLSLRPNCRNSERKGVLFCFREDHEQNIDDSKKESIRNIVKSDSCKNFTTIAPYAVSEKTRKKELQKKFDEIAGAELVVCDRLHAMIFSLITETPCIAFDNKSRKVSGTYKWIEHVPYIKFANDMMELPKLIEELKTSETKNGFLYPVGDLMNVMGVKIDEHFRKSK